MKKDGKFKPIPALTAIALIVVIVAGGLWIWNSGFTDTGTPLQIAAANNGNPSGVACTGLSVAQTPAFQSFDSNTNAALTPSTALYIDPVTGLLNPSTTNTVYGKSYSVLMNKTGYASALVAFSTSCNDPTPMITGKQKALDTSLTFAVYNSDYRTANSVAANQTISAGSQATVEIDLTPSALRKHISGATNEFDVFVNSSLALTQFDTSKFNLGSEGWAKCSPYSAKPGYNAATPSALTGTYVTAFRCTGDISGDNTNIHKLFLTVGTSATYTGGGMLTVGLAPVDFYQNTLTNAVEQGSVKNTGAAIHTLQSALVYIK
jgi:hypothetical protein